MIWRDFFSFLFCQNSHFENLIFDKIHIFKISFLTKFTIHIFKCTLLWTKYQWLLWIHFIVNLAFLPNIWLIQGILVWFLFFILALVHKSWKHWSTTKHRVPQSFFEIWILLKIVKTNCESTLVHQYGLNLNPQVTLTLWGKISIWRKIRECVENEWKTEAITLLSLPVWLAVGPQC